MEFFLTVSYAGKYILESYVLEVTLRLVNAVGWAFEEEEWEVHYEATFVDQYRLKKIKKQKISVWQNLAPAMK